VLCVSRDVARAYCIAQGGDLPTEMQRELVGGGLAGGGFPWGTDVPSCADAVVGRGPESSRFSAIGAEYDRTCIPGLEAPPDLALLGFAMPVTRVSLGRDVVAFGPAHVQDLAGNAAEWTRDVWQERDGPCWAALGALYDPYCDAPPSDHRVIRGGGWSEAPATIDVRYRKPRRHDERGTGIGIGFRCAYRGLAP
jgi:formylglycine-generating enzyme required for sulfatase activity